MRSLSVLVAMLAFAAMVHSQSPARASMQLGVDADDWNNQIRNPAFEKSLKRMQFDFISWHIQPEEESNPDHIKEIAEFCRKNHWHYSFNTEVGNYRRGERLFQHPDGTYRYDLSDETLRRLKDDPLFLGVVYDEGELVQAMLGMPDGKGGTIQPYLANTRNLTPAQAFFAVAEAVSKLRARYTTYGKRVIFEMTFPDYPFAFTRGGALVAPKLLKENFNDLMYADYRGAALEYHSKELWACIDLWFLDKFPFAGKQQAGFHTPAELFDSLQFAYNSGFDYVYIEQIKGLVNDHFDLTEYGQQVVNFQIWRNSHQKGNWRTDRIEYVVKRFPDGYWGQAYSNFIPDHPYGSWLGNPYRQQDARWFKALNELSKGVVPTDADTWNAQRSPAFKTLPYRSSAGLPLMIVVDPFDTFHVPANAKMIDLSR